MKTLNAERNITLTLTNCTICRSVVCNLSEDYKTKHRSLVYYTYIDNWDVRRNPSTRKTDKKKKYDYIAELYKVHTG